MTTLARPKPGRRARRLIGRLLTQALAGGISPTSPAKLRAFPGGLVASFVGVATVTNRFVAKVDEDPAVLVQGRLLECAAKDLRLPESYRLALPAVYALGSHRGLHGYLMEDLSQEYTAVGTCLADDQVEAQAMVAALWELLAELYATTRSTRVLPDIQVDYLDRILPGLAQAAEREPALEGRIELHTGGRTIELPPWRDVIAAARSVVPGYAPSFSTVVHGDPNLWNVLVRKAGSGFDLRLIDPMPWDRGDWVFDLASIGVSLRGILVVEGEPRTAVASLPRITSSNGVTRISYEMHEIPRRLLDAEQALLDQARAFAAAHGDEGWAVRYRLAVGSHYLGLVCPRLAGPECWRHLGIEAFAEGLRAMWEASTSRR